MKKSSPDNAFLISSVDLSKSLSSLIFSLSRFFVADISNRLILFDNYYYDQIDGVAMGSPLGPVFSVSFHEANWIKEYGPGNILFYKIYVDDIFCFLNNEI